jgi:rRNA maturation endonuclease Nob1
MDSDTPESVNLSGFPRMTEMSKLEVGQHVSVSGTGRWHEGAVFFATIADVQADSVKIRYTDGSFKRFPSKEFETVLMPDLPLEVNVTNEVIKETHDKLPSAPEEYTKMHQIHEEIQAAVRQRDFKKAADLKADYQKLSEKQDKIKKLETDLITAVATQDYRRAHELQQELQGIGKPPAASFNDKLAAAGKRALGGGIAGASAMVLQVCSLMWMRTIMNYQYRNGGTFLVSYRTLMAEGGIGRLYSGLGPALLQGPLSRFGDTFANAGVLALCESQPALNALPMGVKTVFASAAAASMRIFLTPIDTVKTMMQANGKEGLPLLRAKIAKSGPQVIFHGATATMAATFVGHYPFFATFNTLQANIDVPKDLPSKLLRNACIGFVSSTVSDTISNSLRVVKTVRQTNATMSYKDIVTGIIEKEGYMGLFGRGLKTRLLCNGTQGLMFSVVYKMVEERLHN